MAAHLSDRKRTHPRPGQQALVALLIAAAITALRDPAARHAAEQASLRRASALPTAQDLLAQLDEVLAPAACRW